MVGTSTAVFAAIGNPVVVVTPDPPIKAAALELTNTPSESGALPIEATRVAVVPTVVCWLKYPDIYFSLTSSTHLDFNQMSRSSSLGTSSTSPLRAVAPNGAHAIADARDLLNRLDTVMLTRQLLDDAGTLLPLRLRSLDAIHLVAAPRAGDTLRAVITYDARMRSAAADLGISTASPR
jgi:hypothetical protein